VGGPLLFPHRVALVVAQCRLSRTHDIRRIVAHLIANHRLFRPGPDAPIRAVIVAHGGQVDRLEAQREGRRVGFQGVIPRRGVHEQGVGDHAPCVLSPGGPGLPGVLIRQPGHAGDADIPIARVHEIAGEPHILVLEAVQRIQAGGLAGVVDHIALAAVVPVLVLRPRIPLHLVLLAVHEDVVFHQVTNAAVEHEPAQHRVVDDVMVYMPVAAVGIEVDAPGVMGRD